MAPSQSDTDHLAGYRDLLKALKGDIRARETRAVLKLTRSLFSRIVGPEDAEAEKKIMQSESYGGLTRRLSDEHKKLSKELIEIEKSGNDPEIDVPDYASYDGPKTRSGMIKARLGENTYRQDMVIEDLERFIDEEERDIREAQYGKDLAEDLKNLKF